MKFGPGEEISTVNRKGEKMRQVSLAGWDTVPIELTLDSRRKPMVMLRNKKDHDLVLEFDNEASRKKFLNKFEQFLASFGKILQRVSFRLKD